MANDAGGAGIIRAHINHYLTSYRVVASGPAAAQFRSVLSPSKLENHVANSDLVITGSGWQTRLETNALNVAISKGIPAVVALDSHLNIEERFAGLAPGALPDLILTEDTASFTAARDFFGGRVTVELLDNTRLIRLLALRGDERAKSPLILSEPIRTPAVEAASRRLSGLLTNSDFAKTFGSPRVRAHPSEISNRNNHLRREKLHLATITADDIEDPIESLSRSSAVFGISSSLLSLSAHSGIPTFSSLTPEQVKDFLPELAVCELVVIGGRFYAIELELRRESYFNLSLGDPLEKGLA